MFAVCAPKVIRLVRVLWRSATGSNTCGKGIARAVWPDGRRPTARRRRGRDGDRQDRARDPAGGGVHRGGPARRRSSRPIRGRSIGASTSARPRCAPPTGRASRTRASTSSIRRNGSPWPTSWRTPVRCWPRVAASDGVALLVGGTGLYLRAVARGLDLEALPDDPELRTAARGGARRRRAAGARGPADGPRTHAGRADRHGQSAPGPPGVGDRRATR